MTGFVSDLIAQLRSLRRHQRGQASLEYLAMILVALGIAVAVGTWLLTTAFTGGITGAISTLLGSLAAFTTSTLP